MNSIPINLLNAFVIFNESRNIDEAAIKLGITQPGLSKQLNLLEDLLQTRIFLMSGRKKILTPFGKDLHRSLKEKIGLVQEVVERIKLIHTNASLATIKIAARRGILDRISSRLKFSGRLIFLESSNDQTVKSLLNLNFDIGIAHSIPDTSELTAGPLFCESFRIVIPKVFLSTKPTYGKPLFAILKKRPCVGYKVRDEIVKAACCYSNSEVTELAMPRITENYASLLGMVNSGIGWAVLPSYFEISEKLNWSVSIPEKVIQGKKFYVVYRPEFSSTPWFKDLIREIHSCF